MPFGSGAFCIFTDYMWCREYFWLFSSVDLVTPSGRQICLGDLSEVSL